MSLHYTPTAEDIAWAADLIARTDDVALWFLPATGLLYKISHRHRKMILQNPEMIAQDLTAFIVHCQTIDVFAAIGYEVREHSHDESESIQCIA